VQGVTILERFGYRLERMTNSLLPQRSDQNVSYPILDALRFALAFWVVIGHFGMFSLFSGVDTTAGFGRTLVRGWNTITFGTAAVIGFFVISGFCIHLPFRGKKNLAIAHYYARRYTRILIPLIGTLPIWRFLLGKRLQILGDESILWHSIFWSLLCEEIYYAAYPMPCLLRNRFGLGRPAWDNFLVERLHFGHASLCSGLACLRTFGNGADSPARLASRLPSRGAGCLA
jgi:peptidoglycan/LPS O-acetylase OafA/YrhL